MKSISFVMGLANGYNDAFKGLDRMVRELNAKELKSITDTLYPAIGGNDRCVDPALDTSIVRVVVYR